MGYGNPASGGRFRHQAIKEIRKMSSVVIQNAPRNLTVQDFRSQSDNYGSLAKVCRFAAVIRPYGQFLLSKMDFSRDLMYLCESTDIPGRGFINLDLRYYGPNFKMPVQTQYDDINMTFLCRTQSLEREFFDDWLSHINPVNTFDFNYRDDYASNIDIYQFAEYAEQGTNDIAPEAQYCITLMDAYPLLVNPQPVTWSDETFQRLVVSFTYTKWFRKGLDPEQRSGAKNGFSFNLVEGRDSN